MRIFLIMMRLTDHGVVDPIPAGQARHHPPESLGFHLAEQTMGVGATWQVGAIGLVG